jgi:alkaline phosphatase D
LTVTFTPAKASAKWNYISTIKAREYQVVESRTKELSMLAGQAQLQNA